jgi:hypothetical protein
MGTSLINTTPANTYPALIKVGDNTPVDGTLQALSDGEGNDLPIEVSSTAVNFTGFVTGLPPQQRGFYPYTVTVGTTSGVISGITSAVAPSGANLIGAAGWLFSLSGTSNVNISVTHPLGNTIFFGTVAGSFTSGIAGASTMIRPYNGRTNITLSMFQNSTDTVITFYANTQNNAGYTNATNTNAFQINFYSSVYL